MSDLSNANLTQDNALELVANRTLVGQTVLIDETHFRNCKILECTLQYSGGPLIFEETELRGCRYVFSGPARMTFEFMELIGLVIPSPPQLM